MRTLRELGEFIVTVGRHWGRLMTGGFIVAAAVLYEHLSERAILGWPLWVAIVMALFISFFLAWRDERNKRVSVEQASAEKDAQHQQEIELFESQITIQANNHVKDIDRLKAEHRKQLSEDNARYEKQHSERLKIIMGLEADIAELQAQKDEKARRRHLRERLGEFLDEGKDRQWNVRVNPLEGYNEYQIWLKQVKQFLEQEPEFDRSHLARFNTNPLDALDMFIKEFMD